jgi:hypothetical protein
VWCVEILDLQGLCREGIEGKEEEGNKIKEGMKTNKIRH